MPKAIRFKANGKYLQNTIFSCPGLDYVGSGTALLDNFDPSDETMMAAVAAEEAMSIESWKNDLAAAFGLSAADIEPEVIAGWNGDPRTLPTADDADPTGKHVRLPQPPEPVELDPDDELAKAIAAATDLASLKAALLGNRGAGKVKGRPV